MQRPRFSPKVVSDGNGFKGFDIKSARKWAASVGAALSILAGGGGVLVGPTLRAGAELEARLEKQEAWTEKHTDWSAERLAEIMDFQSRTEVQLNNIEQKAEFLERQARADHELLSRIDERLAEVQRKLDRR